MSLLVSLLITVAAAAFVAAPFFTRQGPAEFAGQPSARRQDRQKLERQKLDAYAAIKETEFDHRMGKLSEADFAAMRNKFAARALEAIAALESLQAGKARRPGDAPRPGGFAFCPNCGHAAPPRANFCPACGRSLKEAVA